MSLIDDGIQLFLGKLRRVDVIGKRKYAAGGAHFNNVSAILVVETHGVTSLIRSVDHTAQGIALFPEKPLPETAAMIAMAPRRANGVHGDEHARPGYHSFANGVAQTNIEIVAGAYISHGSEARHEGYARVRAGVQRLLGNGFLQAVYSVLFPIVRIHRREVRVGVDEAGQECGVSKIDGFGAGGNDCLCADTGNFSVCDDNQAGT